jgi:alkanesulfonate monooxygenase SsuD/methylene tetrahydromethanopterin reductase-like flavin-dependent oxidoreductase (luciferase family)
MRFGLFGGATAPSPASESVSGSGMDRRPVAPSDDSHAYGDFVESVIQAEALGFHSIFLVEHHFTGAGQLSASLNLLSYLAACTKKIRLGTAVIVVPWHNPVLLAEQAATVDVLSNGRLDLGVGKGYRPGEFDGFCIPIEEAGDRFEESMELLRQSLSSSERFSFHSKRWDFENIVVEPPPIQQPHPPLWLAAGRPDSLRYAAEGGYSLLLDQFATFDVTMERFHTYRGAVEATGRRFDPMNVAVARSAAIVRTEEERENAILKRMETLGRMNRLASSKDGSYRSSMASDPDLRRAAEQGTLIGTPDEIIDHIRQFGNGGVDYILLSGTQGDTRLMHDFATEIMPAFASAAEPLRPRLSIGPANGPRFRRGSRSGHRRSDPVC